MTAHGDRDPLNLRHRVHVSLDATGFRASCTCGWATTASTRGERDQAVEVHHGIPRSRGSHGHVTEGD